jgi:hypothetical protein
VDRRQVSSAVPAPPAHRSYEFTPPDPLIKLPRGLCGLDSELGMKLLLALTILAHRQVRLIQP